jgi:hypothetical protein
MLAFPTNMVVVEAETLLAARSPFMRMVLPLVNPVPERVTLVPTAPEAGEIDVMLTVLVAGIIGEPG